jgi:hypothetical protein
LRYPQTQGFIESIQINYGKKRNYSPKNTHGGTTACRTRPQLQ